LQLLSNIGHLIQANELTVGQLASWKLLLLAGIQYFKGKPDYLIELIGDPWIYLIPLGILQIHSGKVCGDVLTNEASTWVLQVLKLSWDA
jgi:hypothetical protein